MEAPITTLELHGHGHPVPVVVNGDPWALGDATRGRHGLDAIVDERLVRYLALLALRRRGGALDGWTTAADLGQLADRGGTAAAAAKFLERRLVPYPERRGDMPLTEDEQRRGHLIVFEPRHTDERQLQRGGYSRGPYRIGVARRGLQFTDAIAWSWIFPSVIAPPELVDENALTAVDLLERANREFAAGDIVAARASAATGVHLAAARLRLTPGDRDHRFLLAALLDLVSNLDMELGQPRSSLAAAALAERSFGGLRHPLGVAHAHQVRAHALGQLEEVSGAVAAARNAMHVLERARAARSGAGRAGYSGVLGQRLSKDGKHAQAERHLLFALRTCEQAGLAAWSGVWSLRLCENDLATRQFGRAEAHLYRAHGLLSGEVITVPQEAVLKRITAQFLTAVGRRDEAMRWARDAHALGVAKGMANQVRLMLPIIRDLGLADDDEVLGA